MILISFTRCKYKIYHSFGGLNVTCADKVFKIQILRRSHRRIEIKTGSKIENRSWMWIVTFYNQIFHEFSQ